MILNKERFYMLWKDGKGDYYVAYINTKYMTSINRTEIILSASHSGRIKLHNINPTRFEFLFDQFIMFYNETKDIEFFAYNFDDPNHRDTFNIKGLKACLEGLFKDKAAIEYNIGDLLFEDEYLFITDLSYGIFVIQLNQIQDEHLSLNTTSWYLYALTSGPNQIHLERVNSFKYQITVSTTTPNEILVFEPIEYGVKLSSESVLRLDRMFATSIPKYYSFGSKTTLNQNYIVQEMFNSKDKDVTFRILTRALYTLNDATLELENMNLPPSATIYLGFIEPYANIFVHVCSKGITFNYIKNPLITFSVPIVGNEPLSGYKEQSYWISLGGVKAKGKLLVFPKGSHEVIRNPDVKYNFFFKPYDQKNYFLTESPFIGHDLNVTIEIEKEYEELQGHLASPLYLLYHNDNFTENSKNSFIEFSNYSTNRNSLRNHLIFIESDKLKFSYSDANYFIRKIPNFNMPIKRELRGVNMITSMMGKNSTSKNNFLFTFSVIDGVAEVEVFIVSDVVSWVKGILLREIYDDGYKVAPNCSEVNIFSTESVFAVHAQKETSEGVFDNFYFYKVEEMTITMFKVVEAKSFEIQGFKVARNIRIQQNLLYIIYEGFDYFHIMDLRTDKNTFYKKYKVDVYNKDKGILYISGKWWGAKMVIETNSGELYLFDVSDPLFPVYLMTLPVPDGLSPHTKGGNYFYNWIDDHILILPFDEISQFPSPNITMYLMVYDLRRPMHTTLMYRYKIPFEVNDFKSFIHSRFADTDYLYLFADSTVLVLKVFSGFVISFPDENIDYLKQTKGLYFNLVANNNEQKVTQQVTQQVNLYTVQSGIVLKSGSKYIQLHAPKDFKKYYINLDDYFKGFRR